MRRVRVSSSLIAVAALTFAVVACGGDDSGGSSDTGDGGGAETSGDDSGDDSGGGSAGGSGDWTGEIETGTQLSATLWVDATDPALANFEAFREVAGAETVVYGRITATNNGDEEDRGRFLTLTSPDGGPFDEDSIEVNFLCSVVGQWWNDIPADDRVDDVIEQYTSLLNDDCDGVSMGGPPIPVGATVTYWVALPGGEPDFGRVYAGVMSELTR